LMLRFRGLRRSMSPMVFIAAVAADARATGRATPSLRCGTDPAVRSSPDAHSFRTLGVLRNPTYYRPRPSNRSRTHRRPGACPLLCCVRRGRMAARRYIPRFVGIEVGFIVASCRSGFPARRVPGRTESGQEARPTRRTDRGACSMFRTPKT
jgi:hypothetical protein